MPFFYACRSWLDRLAFSQWSIEEIERGIVWARFEKGVDIARNLVEAGNRRARELGQTNLKFEEGDATDLAGLQDKSLDLVVSIFGAMFAPKPFDVAKEMVRR